MGLAAVVLAQLGWVFLAAVVGAVVVVRAIWVLRIPAALLLLVGVSLAARVWLAFLSKHDDLARQSVHLR